MPDARQCGSGAEAVVFAKILCRNDNNAWQRKHTMDKLRALHYLLKVADTLSFSRAAQAFGVPASSISRRIADLEAVSYTHLTLPTKRIV